MALTEQDPWAGIDLDHCIDDTGAIQPWAQAEVIRFNSYTEVTPSDHGLRIFIKGRLPGKGRKKGNLEVYDRGRYLTVTGHHLPGTPLEIHERQAALDAFLAEHFPESKPQENNTDNKARPWLTDDEVIKKATASKQGEKFKRLIAGDSSEYPSQSEADAALALILAFWCDKNLAQMDRILRASGLYREKWDEKRGAKTYGEMTLERAATLCRETYASGVVSSDDTKKIKPEAWEEPLLLGEINTPEIPCNLLPDWLGEYCEAVRRATQTPAGLAVMMGLSTVAACLQKKFEICPYGDDYTEPLPVWTATGLDPGTRKTAVKTAMTGTLVAWETDQAEALRPMLRETQHQRDIGLKRIDQLKVRAAKPDTSDEDREIIMRDIRKIEDELPYDALSPRIWCDDTTPERLQNLMADHGEKMALLSDEGGIFEVMSGLYSNGKVNLNVFLQGHAGSPVRVDRQGRTVTMYKPALTLGLTVQPDVIADLTSGDKRRFRGNGTLARFLYCMPRSTVGSRDMRKRSVLPETTKARYDNGILELLNIHPVYDERGRERPRILSLSPDALSAWVQFSQYIENRLGESGDLFGIQDWASKLPGAALRIAGLFHVVEHGESVPTINRQTIERSLDLAELLIIHAQAAFDLMGADQAFSDAKFILTWIIENGQESFQRSTCLKKHSGRFRRVERLIKALQVLTERNIISEPSKKGTSGRPEIIYFVNPAVLNMGQS
ncbi:MAG TPA: DUF3987 domain-containing protein [Deltaproteobacteria bacterium]|nr:DUF3987 domain-containing protein [Deltaproteobacteria bacterium]